MLISSMRYSPAARTLKVRSGSDGWAVVMLFFWFLSECSTSFTCRWWWWWDANEWTNEEENPQEEKQQRQQFSDFKWAEWMECLILIFPGPWKSGTNPGTSHCHILSSYCSESSFFFSLSFFLGFVLFVFYLILSARLFSLCRWCVWIGDPYITGYFFPDP